jgi:heme A synthase
VQNPTSPRQQVYRFSVWEMIRSRLPVNNLISIAIVFILCGTVIVFELISMLRNLRDYNQNRFSLLCLFIMITISAGISFVLPYMGNGYPDIAKHMFGFIYLFDLIICILVAYGVMKFKRRLKR